MPRTGVLLLNMGGPSTLSEVGTFLNGIFTDREIIQMPFQSVLGPLVAKRRTPKVTRLYESIGGGSPIKKWSTLQGTAMIDKLDQISPHTSPHKFYIAFRYVPPLTETALKQMAEDGIERVVAFPQYPQYSCATSGSSLNLLWKTERELGLTGKFKWSIIDRWYDHPLYVESVVKKVREGLDLFEEQARDKVVLVFSAHSIPMKVVNRGDPYPSQIGATVDLVMRNLNFSHNYTLSYQSKVGPVPWLGPSTVDVVTNLPSQGIKHALVIPIAFTSDHIETLSEIDIELLHEAKKRGIDMKRAPSLNGDATFTDALANIVHEHLESGKIHSNQYKLQCPLCILPEKCKFIPK